MFSITSGRKPGAFFLCLAAVCALSGCATVRHAVPENLLTSATVSGLEHVRAFSGIPSDAFKQDFLELLSKEEYTPPAYYMLAVSGGGASGAYGAGLLCGWSKAGTRPPFKVVTGISAGAIIAPLAFLGPEYDARLKEFFTTYSTRQLLRLRFPFSNSFADTRPLQRLIDKYFDEKLIAAVAKEYGAGRRLYVGTTNLDAQRLVIWDMGKIASVGTEETNNLFRKIILASASVPIAFPPVYFHVQAQGADFDEMHVDGGTSKQVFFLFDVLRGFEHAARLKYGHASQGIYHIYVIRNGYVDPVYAQVPDKLVPIAKRAVDTMINNQGVGDLYQLYTFAQEGRGDFNLAYIPATHISREKEPFDRKEMSALFDLGYSEAEKGYSWRKAPPGVEFSEE